MAKLKLGTIADDKPVKLTVELPANVHRDLAAYADVLARETGQSILGPAKLVALKHLEGLGVAHRDVPAAFDFLHFLPCEPLVGPLPERPGGRRPVLDELLLGARVSAALSRSRRASASENVPSLPLP